MAGNKRMVSLLERVKVVQQRDQLPAALVKLGYLHFLLDKAAP